MTIIPIRPYIDRQAALYNEHRNHGSYLCLLPNDIINYLIQPMLESIHQQYIASLIQLYNNVSMRLVLRCSDAQTVDVTEYLIHYMHDAIHRGCIIEYIILCYFGKTVANAHYLIVHIYTELLIIGDWKSCVHFIGNLLHNGKTKPIFRALLAMHPLSPAELHSLFLLAIRRNVAVECQYLLKYYDINQFQPNERVNDAPSLVESIAELLCSTDYSYETFVWLTNKGLLSGLLPHSDEIWDIVIKSRQPTNEIDIEYLYTNKVLTISEHNRCKLYNDMYNRYKRRAKFLYADQDGTFLTQITSAIELTNDQQHIMAELIREHDRKLIDRLTSMLGL